MNENNVLPTIKEITIDKLQEENRRLKQELEEIRWNVKKKHYSEKLRLRFLFDPSESDGRQNIKLVKENRIFNFFYRWFKYDEADKLLSEGATIEEIVKVIKEYVNDIKIEEKEEDKNE